MRFRVTGRVSGRKPGRNLNRRAEVTHSGGAFRGAETPYSARDLRVIPKSLSPA